MRRIALSLPLLGWVGVLVLIGWKLGPWLPVGLTAATGLLLGFGWYRAHVPREIEGDRARVPRENESDSAAVREWRDERIDKVGRWFSAITGIWLAVSIVLLVLIVIAALLSR